MLATLSIGTSLPAGRFRPEAWDDVLGLERAFQALNLLKTPWEWFIVGKINAIKEKCSFKDDERIVFIETDACAPVALNVGLYSSTGQFWIHLDGASQLLLGIDQAVEDIKKHENVAYAYGHTIDWEYENGIEVSVDMKGGFGIIAPGEIASRWETHHGWNFVPACALWRKEHLVAVGGYPAYSKDIESAPLVFASLEAPCLSVDAEMYKLTRFKAAPDRTGTSTFEIDRTSLMLHENIKARRKLYGKGLLPFVEKN